MSRPDPTPDPASDELAPVRAALTRRATDPVPGDPTHLYASAQHRARARHRHQMGAGLLVAAVLMGSVVGLVTLNHGRTTVGVSVAEPGVGPVTTATDLAPGTTLAGGTAPPSTADCAEGFFSAADKARLVAHFGPVTTCYLAGDIWIVGFGRRGDAVMPVAVLLCAPTDESCLQPAAPHDFADFRMAFMPGPTDGVDYFSYALATPGGTAIMAFDTAQWPAQGIPASYQPMPALQIQRAGDGTPELIFGAVCQHASGPSATHWVGGIATVSGATALAQPVPTHPSVPATPTSC